MKKMICLAALATCLTVFSSVALAQRFAVIGKAGFEPGEYNPLFGQKYLRGLKTDGVIPGAEFIINFGHRWLTVSFEYAHQKFTAVSSHVVQTSDGFSYLDPDGKLVFFSMPGKEIVGFDLTGNHEINLIGGNFYLNVVREGRVMPTVGIKF